MINYLISGNELNAIDLWIQNLKFIILNCIY